LAFANGKDRKPVAKSNSIGQNTTISITFAIVVASVIFSFGATYSRIGSLDTQQHNDEIAVTTAIEAIKGELRDIRAQVVYKSVAEKTLEGLEFKIKVLTDEINRLRK